MRLVSLTWTREWRLVHTWDALLDANVHHRRPLIFVTVDDAAAAAVRARKRAARAASASKQVEP